MFDPGSAILVTHPNRFATDLVVHTARKFEFFKRIGFVVATKSERRDRWRTDSSALREWRCLGRI